MGSDRTNQEIAIHNAQVISDLEEYLHNLTKQGDPNDKRADKITQWVEVWTKHLKNEKRFNPKSISAFKRGSIVYVDLGFNVGSEYGGVHYGIVLNKIDSRKNHLLHILPLTSTKVSTDTNNLKYFQLNLDNEVHKLLIQKAMNRIAESKEKEKELKDKRKIQNDKIKELEKLLKLQDISNINKDFENYFNQEIKSIEDSILEINSLLSAYQQQIEYTIRLIEKINKLKEGSIALLNQFTTISKMRLLDPVNKNSLLTDIVLSTETMEKIDNALNNIF
ncbi:type II toxin-antitoxin system PemK/MazF family toxin [Streptococcus parauberis]|uniref:type II toxin-antitoxin system PemK/MazF family toxin n=1 Tax=Streptococcus parauberis TaxID=1348 RepID=UPI0002D86911|nr:type II toxin-antitoxin system PemK/MazF family toxin [Streptococcus parauberis]QBX09789.1 hypothetical protein JavanS387_0022 [Streptococcus satellite phage Javan387]QBX10021.1 hypothetical protein JavanS403_0022 [Streptococcus satellite phage Javan403]UWM90620.1 type II toxin-antitoxin system PemK/MazF family toxin [Streptococcus parauberis]WEM62785.1 type II toxin-antitoxin system PemK/MazF family toxin [Streptococcus parauberis]GAJ60818.1 MazF family toxin-antitoxin system [Streptococcu